MPHPLVFGFSKGAGLESTSLQASSRKKLSDQLNRLTQKSYPDTTAVNYTYDNDSRLTQASDPTGTYQFTFDDMGRLTGTTTSYAFLTGRNFTTSYSYDKASNRTGFTDPESGSTAYVYDTLNRLQDRGAQDGQPPSRLPGLLPGRRGQPLRHHGTRSRNALTRCCGNGSAQAA